ncbi:SocA family protein [Pseudomonas gingeri]|uniref:type II toxin-antitoxin system antitoxin SocA domain-containing protein n=1 Tax=Pseudomonas gingeri TaxID=117681 RepID=UPI0015A0F4C6|nr:SocA family protein [Pseudomonas gingeri]NWE46870.1 SocA family protein [Pseudomonas gingeri]
MFDAKSIANYFLELAAARGESISPMKLQKLVYYAHGWYAGYTDQPLINEAVEAWQYGPVIPSLYHEFKRFGSGEIAGKAFEYDALGVREAAVPADPEIRTFLQNVYNSYGRYSGIRLSEMTHASGTPWDMTWSAAKGVRGVDIPFPMIAAHFKEATQKAQNGQAAVQA